MAVNFNIMDLGRAGLLEPERMGYKDSLEIIQDESLKVQKSFVKIGWYLKHIRDNELYKEDGYANIYECAADQLGYSQSTSSRFIKICEKFSKNGNSPQLDEKYAGFDKSQMIEMLPMGPDQLEKVTPDMSVAKIRAVKNESQTSIEKDFPEYLPESETENPCEPNLDEEKYATSHIENEINVQNEELAEQGADNGQDVIIDGTYREIKELPMLKNNEQRAEWLENYKAWGLWYRDEHIDVNYYKFDFPDGSRLIVSEYPQRRSYYSKMPQDECFYHLLEKNKKGYNETYDESYRHTPESATYLIGFLKNIQKK